MAEEHEAPELCLGDPLVRLRDVGLQPHAEEAVREVQEAGAVGGQQRLRVRVEHLRPGSAPGHQLLVGQQLVVLEVGQHQGAGEAHLLGEPGSLEARHLSLGSRPLGLHQSSRLGSHQLLMLPLLLLLLRL